MADSDSPRAGRFYSWLEEELNGFASSASTYERAAQESIPAEASAVLSVLQEAWDAYAILVRQDPAYAVPRTMVSFLISHEGAPRGSLGQRLELLERYLSRRAIFYEQREGEDAQLRQALFNEVGKALDEGTPSALFADVFAAAFAEEAEGEEPAWEELEVEGGPYGVVYEYSDIRDAEAAYAGDQPPYDRAEGVHVILWNPLSEGEREAVVALLDGEAIDDLSDAEHQARTELLSRARAKLARRDGR